MNYIGIDLGTSSIKGLLVNEKGKILNEASYMYDVSYPAPNYSEQNPEDWIKGLTFVLNKLSDNNRNTIGGISFGGQMHGLVILDENDNVIRPCILWNDGRTEEETKYLNEVIGKKKLSDLTANIAFAGFTAPKLLWLAKNEPENFAKINKIMLPKDYLVYYLTGKFVSDYSDASGTLFFDVADILRRHQPKAFFLENVKGLAIHDKGKTLETILNTLDEVGYVVPDPQILNAMHYGVPQHRERIYIVGFRKDLGISKQDFSYPEKLDNIPCWLDVREENPVPAKYYLSETYIETLRRHRARHEAAGHGFGYKIIDDNSVANAIVCGGMGRECNLVLDFRQKNLTPTTNIKGEINKEGIRKMTPREWARLQGYPDTFQIVVADASAYKQFGNSVAVPAIQATAKQILYTLRNHNII